MLKKILTTIVFLVFTAILVAGGIIRTQAVTGSPETGSKEIADSQSPEPSDNTSADRVTLTGEIQSWQDGILEVLIDMGGLVLIDGRGGRFLGERAFSASAGDRVNLTGFYEGDEFEVAIITNEATGVSVRLRGDDGRPVWGGGGGG
jgi:hypothetical protein